MVTRKELEQLISTGDRKQVREAVTQLLDGFTEFHEITNKTRTTQKSFFAAKKVANIIEANKHLLASKDLEKTLDKSLKEWSVILASPADGAQTDLFNDR